jgi:predicted DNA-binding protein (MmcQ/YjbR family)
VNIEELREYCLSKKGVTESFPFDETTLVFKIMGKIFSFTDLEGDLSINHKCDPDRLIKEWIDHSYDMVIRQLPKKASIK